MARTWQEDAIALGLDPDTLQSSVRQPIVPAEPEPAPRRSKYGAVRTEYAGRKYDSRAEARRAKELDDLKAAGAIRDWQPQPVYHLGCPENTYIADFLIVAESATGEWIVWAEDVKGHRTAKFRHDLRLWRSYGPYPLHVLHRKQIEVIEGA